MNIGSKFLHRVYRIGVKVFLNLAFDFYSWKSDNIPNGPKIYVSNHFSSSDAHMVTTLMKEDLHMVISRAFTVPLLKTYLKLAEQIPADTKANRALVIDRCVNYLKKGESIYIFPEGMLNTDNELLEFKKGVARIYLKYPVPIVPIGLIAPKRSVKSKVGKLNNYDMKVVSKNYYCNIGDAMTFEDEEKLEDKDKAEQIIMDKIKNEVQYLIDDIRNNKFWS